MNSGQAIRWLAHEAKTCRDRDALEMHALLYPAVLKLCDLEAMDDFEAQCFTRDFKERLARLNQPSPAPRPGVFARLLE